MNTIIAGVYVGVVQTRWQHSTFLIEAARIYNMCRYIFNGTVKQSDFREMHAYLQTVARRNLRTSALRYDWSNTEAERIGVSAYALDLANEIDRIMVISRAQIGETVGQLADFFIGRHWYGGYIRYIEDDVVRSRVITCLERTDQYEGGEQLITRSNAGCALIASHASIAMYSRGARLPMDTVRGVYDLTMLCKCHHCDDLIYDPDVCHLCGGTLTGYDCEYCGHGSDAVLLCLCDDDDECEACRTHISNGREPLDDMFITNQAISVARNIASSYANANVSMAEQLNGWLNTPMWL